MKTIGIVYPAYLLANDLEAKGVSILEGLGYGVKLFKPSHPDWIFSGTDEERGRMFTAAFLDSEVDFVLAMRGGYGCARMVDFVDWERIKRNAKPFMGFSDITYLINYMSQTLCMPDMYHGPMVCSFLGKNEKVVDVFLHTLERAVNQGMADEPSDLLSPESEVIAHGICSAAVIVGGNVTLLETSFDTHYGVELSGKLLMIEDTDGEFYTIDRMLRVWVRAGRLNGLAGLLIGEFSSVPKYDHSMTLNKLAADIFKSCGFPVVTGFRIGHGDANRSVRIGDVFTLDARGKRAELYFA